MNAGQEGASQQAFVVKLAGKIPTPQNKHSTVLKLAGKMLTSQIFL